MRKPNLDTRHPRRVSSFFFVPRRRETGTRKADAAMQVLHFPASPVIQDDFCSAAKFHPAKPKPAPTPSGENHACQGPRARRGPRVLRGAAFLARRVGTTKVFCESAGEELFQAGIFLLTFGANKW
jgi:hypothetical protein